MRPLRARLQETATVTGIGIQIVEKDYALSYILTGLVSCPALSGSLVFKGGTALKKLFFGDYRFSEDLDFSAVSAPQGDDLEQAIHNAVDESVRLLSEHGPFSVEVKRYLERDPHPHGQEAFVVRVRFPWQPSPLCRIKLEICHDEPVLLDPDARLLIHGYGEEMNVRVPSYRLEEIITEKMRSLLQTHKKLVMRGWNRPRARDYYDLWRLLSTFDAEIDRTILPSLLERKCTYREVGYTCIDDFFTDQLVTEAHTHWESNLRPFVTDLPDCDIVFVDLRRMITEFFPVF